MIMRVTFSVPVSAEFVVSVAVIVTGKLPACVGVPDSAPPILRVMPDGNPVAAKV